MKKNFDYENINLVPKKGIVKSRSECNTISWLGNFNFNLPVVPANMESIINEEIAIKLAENKYFYIMHRFDVDILNFIKKMKSMDLFTSISVGVNDIDYQLLDSLVVNDLIPDYITIDIAHGHCIKMEEMLKFIKNNIKFKNTFIIAGNICTTDAVKDLYDWGANAVKVGIGGGMACSTYMETRFGNRGMQASMIKELSDFISRSCSNLALIADGGIRERGDIVAALVMGADMVMIGGLFAGHIDSPGDIIEVNDVKYKGYWGSASQHQSGKTSRIEGIKHQILLKDKHVLDEMTSIQEAIQSGISYAGGNNLNIFNHTDFIVK